MGLDDVWFGLFVVIIAGYLILDGFDIGVGILHLFVAKDDTERRISLNSIGPIWDGNEVWLVLGGGVLFAAFPPVYGALLSGFYGGIMLVLLSLILRTVAIEFRGQRQSPRWRSFWDGVFAVASLGIALLLGVAFGNIIAGVPVNQDGHVAFDNVSDLVTPFAIWLGLTTVVMLAMHGALYLNLKTEGELQARVRRLIRPLMVAFGAMAVLSVVFVAMVNSELLDVYEKVWPLIFPVGAAAAFLFGVDKLQQGHDGVAFACSSVTIALVLFSIAAGLFPDLLPSSSDQEYSLTVSNSAAANNTLTVMLVVAIIGMPFVLLYSAGVNYIFRGKVRLSPDSY